MEWTKVDNIIHADLPTGWNLRGKETCVIYTYKDSDKIILGINGYRFEHKSIEDAKEDAVDRVTNNKGIYLQYYL